MRITDEMVERAAKAIERKAWPDRPWRKIYESARERFRDAARAALKAALDSTK